MNKQKFQLLREQIMDSKDPLQQATFFFILNRTSFSGSTLSGGFSKEATKKRFTKSSIQRVKNLSLEEVEFFNMDFEPFIKQIKSPILISYEGALPQSEAFERIRRGEAK